MQATKALSNNLSAIAQSDAVLLSASEHKIDSADIDDSAIQVVETLATAGYEVFLVGGCVRDLLLKRQPKDFDVATNATPEQINQLFRRSRIIGRRFRIVHVRFKREIIEVSTFRRAVDKEDISLAHSRKDLSGKVSAQSSKGVMLRDNAYGSLNEDVFRRDFTVNALYYDPLSGTLIDHVKGMQDLDAGVLRIIGNAEQRYREDPGRMLRAVRFSAKLGFELDNDSSQAIHHTAELIGEVSPARLFDELSKMFLSGNAEKIWELLVHYNLASLLFPSVSDDHSMIIESMRSTDTRISAEKPVTPGFIYGVLLWSALQRRTQSHSANMSVPQARETAAAEVIAEQQPNISIPKRFTQFIRDVWRLQPKLEKRQSRQIERTLGDRRFRAAYDFLLMRCSAGELPSELADWWTRIQEVDSDERAQMIRDQQTRGNKNPKRKKKKPSRPQP
ncbi:MAG: polynucleotide adenylyltransferase PcnB [Pseudomonadales bacterium]|nr:polynucleotide adenylyltransferase PcnB [Pseudomonadales bacterium]